MPHHEDPDAPSSAVESKTHWWHGLRGEWYVVAQAVIIALVAFGPRTLPGIPLSCG